MTRAFAHDRFTYPLPEGHRFPLGRYRMLREAIEQQGIAEVVEAPGPPTATSCWRMTRATSSA